MVQIIFVLYTQVVLQKPKCIRDREGKITLSISNQWGNYLWKISTEQGLGSWTSISPSSGIDWLRLDSMLNEIKKKEFWSFHYSSYINSYFMLEWQKIYLVLHAENQLLILDEKFETFTETLLFVKFINKTSVFMI